MPECRSSAFLTSALHAYALVDSKNKSGTAYIPSDTRIVSVNNFQ